MIYHQNYCYFTYNLYITPVSKPPVSSTVFVKPAAKFPFSSKCDGAASATCAPAKAACVPDFSPTSTIFETDSWTS